ncbi:hypothetical protein GQ55_6G144100 [Panicum hallii var. hallii]|uniref:Uncharacterized protein n=1 Tax=Panicum hallii var. hallii TaxID=1504633 RepID=A0A2T7D660_9POAL|nr:hypothetical protein GQ55_6G144100 [Panicum hallii var. hallii]
MSLAPAARAGGRRCPSRLPLAARACGRRAEEAGTSSEKVKDCSPPSKKRGEPSPAARAGGRHSAAVPPARPPSVPPSPTQVAAAAPPGSRLPRTQVVAVVSPTAARAGGRHNAFARRPRSDGDGDGEVSKPTGGTSTPTTAAARKAQPPTGCSGGPELPPPHANRRRRRLLTWIRDDSSTQEPGQAVPLPQPTTSKIESMSFEAAGHGSNFLYSETERLG